MSTSQLKYFHIFMLKLINFPWRPMLTTGFISLFILAMPILEQLLYIQRKLIKIFYTSFLSFILSLNCKQP